MVIDLSFVLAYWFGDREVYLLMSKDDDDFLGTLVHPLAILVEALCRLLLNLDTGGVTPIRLSDRID